MDRFELFLRADATWGFRLVAANGEIVAESQGYASRSSALRGCHDVARIAAAADIVTLSPTVTLGTTASGGPV